jgi:hypothetical protein
VKFPRQQRFVLAGAVQRTALLLHEQLIEATHTAELSRALRAADVTLTKLRFYLRLCQDLGLLSPGQYAHAAQRVNEIGRLLGGWLKQASGPKSSSPPAPGPLARRRG